MTNNPSLLSVLSLYQDLNDRMASLRHDSSSVATSRTLVENALLDGKVYYGINTGFGALASSRIGGEDLKALQRNLLFSHAVGVGEPVPREITRLMLQLKIHSLSLGLSGVSSSTFERLLIMEELDLIPVVPTRGSVGASGDLAPLAHLSLPLIGGGEIWSDNGDRVAAASVLQKHGLEPIELQAKDGLSLINGTQLMCAYGAYILNRSLGILSFADIIAATSLEALQGSARPFDPRVHDARNHRGQGIVAENIRTLLQESEILESHRNCGKVQDPYSLRCVPQVHGATRDAIDYCVRVIDTEMNSVTDNPLVFDDGDIISCGNFHGQPLALALDFAAIALSELASISERRLYLLLAGHDGLPRLLMKETGINSGFMIPQYTSAALVSENKVLSHPAAVDSIPTSLGQEDHVSMGSISALKLYQIFQNLETVLAIELIAAAQALDYRQPLRPGKGVEVAHQFLRESIPHREADYYFHDDLDPLMEIIRSGKLLDSLRNSGISIN